MFPFKSKIASATTPAPAGTISTQTALNIRRTQLIEAASKGLIMPKQFEEEFQKMESMLGSGMNNSLANHIADSQKYSNAMINRLDGLAGMGSYVPPSAPAFPKAVQLHAHENQVPEALRGRYRAVKALVELDPDISRLYARATLCGVDVVAQNTVDQTMAMPYGGGQAPLRISASILSRRGISMNCHADVETDSPAMIREILGRMLTGILGTMAPYQGEAAIDETPQA